MQKRQEIQTKINPQSILTKTKGPIGELDTKSIDGITNKLFKTQCDQRHTDAYNHLNNAAFSLYFNIPTAELLSELGLSYDRLLANKDIVFLKKAKYEFYNQVNNQESIEVLSGFTPSDECGLQYCIDNRMYRQGEEVAHACFKHEYGNGNIDGEISPVYYPLLFDKARKNMQKELSYPDKKLNKEGLALVVSEAEYCNEKTLEPQKDVLIDTELEKDRNSFYMHHQMYQEGKKISEATTKHGLVDLQTGHVLRMYKYLDNL